jgi:hypothetical protein
VAGKGTNDPVFFKPKVPQGKETESKLSRNLIYMDILFLYVFLQRMHFLRVNVFIWIRSASHLCSNWSEIKVDDFEAIRLGSGR